MTMTYNQLYEQICRKGSFLCVGLDTDIEKKKALVERLDGCEGEKAAGRLEIIRQELDLALKAREYVLGVAYGKGQRDSD